jgi:hypothetical protein
VLQAGGEMDFPLKPFGSERHRQLRAQQLEGYGAAMAQIPGEVYRGHPATSDLSLDLVRSPDAGLKAL